jgi:hypothetical protein
LSLKIGGAVRHSGTLQVNALNSLQIIVAFSEEEIVSSYSHQTGISP